MTKTDFQQELIDTITPVRLKAYGDDSYEILLEKYIYNLKVSESLYPALSLLEVTLRNKICYAIEALICKDWLINELNQQNLLFDKEYKKLIETADKIEKDGKKVTNDRLISELTFGFWIYLCTKSYKPKFWDKKGFIELVFPNYTVSSNFRNISLIQKDLRDVLKLRNRISHQEIIINGNRTPEESYKLIQTLLHTLSSGMYALLEDISRFNAITKQKP
jgi:hypothetical protein